MVSHSAWAHYGMVIPSDSMVMQGESKTVTLLLSFSHPFEKHGMELVKPKFFGVAGGGKMKNLLDGLAQVGFESGAGEVFAEVRFDEGFAKG